MSIDPDDEIVAVKQILISKINCLYQLESNDDQDGIGANQGDIGKVTKGTRIMELRNLDRMGILMRLFS